ncbi:MULTISPECIES: membrane protein insertase YidC [unclassified Mycoplasma]|uniref:membrane protein insertase YidC n=1 Tax=unclassified Mycoplasma TaxID=2683645 RepID=UPI00211B9343|nr:MULTISPECIES: membrane protein insertase YidC [unclassified Mycoplasma]UUM19867.1 membrane protein insertase YidC [Mycoplasma sp. 1578d]UUM24851.1 membrane protein insertase YidC [Mycoplasma sp. 3686d]
MERSDKFNYFLQNKDPGERRKKLLKRSWKWLKIITVIIVLGFTLTGCIQSFVIKQSTNVGAGLEFTSSKDKIGPKVTVLEEQKETLELPSSGENSETTKININTYKQNTNANPYISNQTVLDQVKKQLNGQDGEKGYFGRDNTYSSGIVLNKDKDTIYHNQNNNYLVAAISARSDIKRELPDYNFVNEIKDIYFFNFYSKENNKIEFLKYLKPNKSESEKTELTSNAKDAINNGVISVGWVSGLSKLDPYTETKISSINGENKFEQQEKLLIKKFNRDVLQMFYNKTFAPDSDFVKQLGKDPSLFLKEKIDQAQINAQAKKPVLFTLTPKQEVLIQEYIKLMGSWFSQTGYTLQDKTAFDPKEEAQNSDQNAKATSANSNENKTAEKPQDPRTYLYDQNLIQIDNNVNRLTFQDPLPLLNISTWGKAWKYGPFYGIFVYPTSAVINALSEWIGILNGWGTIIVIFLVTFIIRGAVFALTFKSTAKMSVQEELKSKRAIIEAKYADFENNKAMKARKAQELQALNKKYNISFLDTIGAQILTLPIFITMWRAIQIIPSIKSTEWLGINFSSTSYTKVGEGEFIYLLVLVIAVLIQLISSVLPMLLNKKRYKERTSLKEQQALKKQERTQRIMIIVFTVFVILFSAGVQIYWIFTGLFTIIQTLVMWRVKKTQWFKDRFSLKALARQ